MENSTFVWLIVVFATLGGIGQATRASKASANFVEQRDALHDRSSKDLMARRRASTQCGSREERIEEFLKHRDPIGYSRPETRRQP